MNIGSPVPSRHCAVGALTLVSAVTMTLLAATVAGAQASRPWAVSPGDPLAAYLRVAELAGDLPAHQWTVRGYGPRDPGRGVATGTDPWGIGARLVDTSAERFAWSPLVLQGVVNSGLPSGFNDGALWAGRGLTLGIEGGFWATHRFLSVSIYPVAFWTQNAAFPLVPNGQAGAQSYGDPLRSGLDRPQRFGARPYAAMDPGQSSIAVDFKGMRIQLSTANHIWGPAFESPLILGDNAAGFPHALLGTSAPLSVGIGRVHGLVLWGRGTPSAYAATSESEQYLTAAAATFSPRGMEGLEIGAARFYHIESTRGVPDRFWLRTFQGVLKTSLASGENPAGDDPNDNQLASIFFRLAFPGHGFEVFGEYGREDHNWNVRDLAGQPDHDAAYLLGIQRVWKRGNGYAVLAGEILNTRLSHLYQSLSQATWYTHAPYGHTERGQVLGAASGAGGGGAMISLSGYFPSGSREFTVRRQMLNEVTGPFANPLPDAARVHQEIAFQSTRRYSGGGSITWSTSLAIEYNRPTQGDTFNAQVAVRLALPRIGR